MTLSIDEIARRIYDDICGTPQDLFGYIDELIEDGTITKDWYKQNETNLLYAVDNQMFNCGICGWNVEVSEMSLSNMGETVCCDCGVDDES